MDVTPQNNGLRNRTRSRHLSRALGSVSAALVLLVLSGTCEAKEFDWTDLGVQLANAKPTLSGQGAASNLRILVSPQRRITKNYEFDYSNSSQSSPSQGDASYVVSSASGSPYLSQPVYQLSPNHSSAYSALSASLASLKSRLSARGVTLTSTLGENGSQPMTTSHLYTTQSAYGPSTMLLDSSQQQVGQAQQQQQQQPTAVQQQHQQQQQFVQSQGPAQSTYLGLASQQDQQASSAYTLPPGQPNDNKTIVLAIPAKINFLTGSKQHSQQQQQQAQVHAQAQQHMGVIQAASGSDQQTRPEYATKQQLNVLGGSDGGLEATGQMSAGDGQEQHQYVIVNQQGQQLNSDHHSHSVAANLSPTAVSANGQIYSTSTIYQAAPSTSGYAMKYIPTYAQTTNHQQHQPVQKVYSVIEASQMPLGAQQLQQSPLPQIQTSAYEPQTVYEPQTGSPTARYTTCLDTCNSADPRWRKYTVSRYKTCCSRSAQFDPSFEQPSAERVADNSNRYSEDAYYNYLYRRSRARRSRRARQYRYQQQPQSASRPQYHNAASNGPLSGAQSEDEIQPNDPPSSPATHEAAKGGTLTSSRYYSHEYPYMKHHRNSRGYASSASSQASADPAPLGEEKYVKAERAYRRGRSRELEPTGEPLPVGDNIEDDSVYPPPAVPATPISGYGGGEYSVDSQAAGRGYGGAMGAELSDDEQTRFDESADLEPTSKSGDESYAHDEPTDEGEPEGPSYKHANGARRKKSKPVPRQRKQGGKESKSYSKKSSARKNKYGKAEHSNGTDYESAQAAGDHHSDQQAGGEQDDQSGSYSSSSSSSSSASKDGQPGSSPYDQSESDKEAVLAKYRASLNDTTVASLSKTTMHLKEILSILERKTHLKANDTSNQQQAPNQMQQSQQQVNLAPALPVTSTPIPATTTAPYPPFSSLLGGTQFNTAMSSDFLTTDFGLKSPYRYEASPLASSLSSSAALSLPSSFGSFASADTFNPITPPYPSQYGMHASKHSATHPNGAHRKRRPSKSSRYNDLMFQKAAHSLINQPSILHAAAKNRLLNPTYYSSMQYPYLYRGSASALTNPYPYKNLNKNPYSALLNGPVSSKLANQLYTDESRLHGLTSLDPLANMASSLRPTSSLRLRNKPFVFQPQVLPIYTRHTILTHPLDATKA